MTNSQILPAVSIKTRILFSFLVVILTLSVSIALLGYYVTKRDIFERPNERSSVT